MFEGLGPETPIGRIVQIRSEKDREVIKKWSPELRKIRNEWVKKQQSTDSAEKEVQAWTRVFKGLKGRK